MSSYIKTNILEVVLYLPAGIVISMLIICFYALCQSLRNKPIRVTHFLSLFLFVTYMAILIEVAILSREPGSRDSIDLILFGTWGDTLQSKAYVIENGIMFLPYGLLLPLICKPTRKFGNFLIVALGSSISLEGIQFLTKRGYCQIDDVMMNVLGGILGFLIMRIALSIWFKRKGG